MIFQRIASGAPAAESLLGLVIYGPPAVQYGWAFGEVVKLENIAIGIPHLADVSLEV